MGEGPLARLGTEEQREKEGDYLGGYSINPGGRWWWLRPEW